MTVNTLLAQDIHVIEDFGRAAFTDETNVHPVGLVMLVAASLTTLGLPRRYALIPFLLLMTLVPSGQRVAIMQLDFTFLRLLIVAGFVRVLMRGENLGLVRKPMDVLMLAWAASSFGAMVIRTNGGAFIGELGVKFDALGGYFLARCLLRDWDDIDRLAQAASVVVLPVMLAFLIELSTQRNLFAFMGGVPEITMIREDRIRCQGPYNHPILAGCFWAALLPLMAVRWWRGGTAKLVALLATGAALTIVYCCASSTPIFGVIGALIGAVFFAFRSNMRIVRWGILLLVIGLHMVMNAPVWHLVSRVSAVGGSTSHFRYLLIDSFIRRFSEWAVIGANSTAHWFWGAEDLTNYYVAQGVTGGLASLVLFLAVISVGFGGIGRAWRECRQGSPELFLGWALGVSLLVHVFNFFGVSYFGTITALWYLTLGAIGSLSPLKHAGGDALDDA